MGANCKAGDPCSICHTEFAAEEEVSQLPCEHCFHDSCIKPWLEVQNTCPICRAVLPRSEAPASSSGAEAGQQPGVTGLGPLQQGQNLNFAELTQNLFRGPVRPFLLKLSVTLYFPGHLSLISVLSHISFWSFASSQTLGLLSSAADSLRTGVLLKMIKDTLCSFPSPTPSENIW